MKVKFEWDENKNQENIEKTLQIDIDADAIDLFRYQGIHNGKKIGNTDDKIDRVQRCAGQRCSALKLDEGGNAK